MESRTVPTTMQAIEINDYDEQLTSLHLVHKPVPKPDKDQVLVRMAAAPVNPSDLMFMRGDYGVRKNLPIVPGFEGSGVVVSAGGGLPARALVGRRVACGAQDQCDGTWAEYMVTRWNRCVPLRKQVSLEEGATLLANPLAAITMIGMARRGHHRAMAQTAAASALGRMIVNLGRRFRVPVVNIVRRQDQVDLLRLHGAEYVLNSSQPDFDDRLRELCDQLQVTFAIDAVGGELTGRVAHAMPRHSRVLVFGALAKENCAIAPNDFIFEGKVIEGFWMADWLPRQNLFYQLSLAGQAQELVQTDLKTEIRERLALAAGPSALSDYASRMTDGKLLLVPDPNAPA